MAYITKTQTPNSQIEEVCRRFYDQARLLLPLDTVTIVLLDADRNTGRAVFSWRSETEAGPSPWTHPRILDDKGTQLLPAMNLTIQGNYDVLGSVSIIAPISGGFSQAEYLLGTDLVKQLALNLENVRLHQQVQSNERRNKFLHKVNDLLVKAEDLEELFGNLVRSIGTEIDIDRAVLGWITSGGYQIDALITTPKTTDAVTRSDPAALQEFFPYNQNIPLCHKNEVFGSFDLARAGSPFGDSDSELLQIVANHIAPAVHEIALTEPPMQRRYWLAGHETHQTPTVGKDGPPSNLPEERHISDLAHALYSPLTSIKGYTDTLLQPGYQWSEEANHEFLQTIHEAADRLDHAIRDLLVPMADKQRRIASQCGQTWIQDLFRLLELDLATPSGASGVRFRCDPGLPRVDLDPYRLSGVLGHLIDFSSLNGSEATNAEVRAEGGRDFAQVSLKFNSAGIVASTAASLASDLRVIASRRLLKEQGIDLSIEKPEKRCALFRFAVPFSQG